MFISIGFGILTVAIVILTLWAFFYIVDTIKGSLGGIEPMGRLIIGLIVLAYAFLIIGIIIEYINQ